MAKPQFLDEEQVADRNEHRWLHNRVEELERQLRLRTIVLTGSVALSAFLGSFIVGSFYKPERPTVALAVAPCFDRASSLPSVTWKAEQPSIDRSQAWAVGEERIEAIAALHFGAQTRQIPSDELTTTWRRAEGSEAVKPEASPKREIRGAGSETAAHECSPASPETAVGASLNQDGSRAARANGRLHYAATDFVNLRAAPSNSAEVLTVVAQGDLVRRTGNDLGWLQVEYTDRSASSIRGWVYSSHLRPVETSGEPARP